MNIHHIWKLKNICLAILGVIIAYLLYKTDIFRQFISYFDSFGYISAFFAGFLFVNVFTAPTAILAIITLAEHLSPIEIGITASIGAVLGDYLLFRFAKNKLARELEFVLKKVDKDRHLHLARLMHLKYLTWTMPIIGAIIIASPLPDEIGVSLLGISKIKGYQFAVLSFILHAIGISSVVSVSLIT